MIHNPPALFTQRLVFRSLLLMQQQQECKQLPQGRLSVMGSLQRSDTLTVRPFQAICSFGSFQPQRVNVMRLTGWPADGFTRFS